MCSIPVNATERTAAAERSSLPVAAWGVAGLLLFGVCASGTSFFALLFPQTGLRHIWRLNPQAEPQLLGLGAGGVLLMGAVCLACAVGSIGLLRRRWWGHRVALGILAVNVTADAVSAFVRDDLRTLIGVPIGMLLIFYLTRPHILSLYRRSSGNPSLGEKAL